MMVKLEIQIKPHALFSPIAFPRFHPKFDSTEQSQQLLTPLLPSVLCPALICYPEQNRYQAALHFLSSATPH
jgi:hypothetical protein